MGQFTETVRFVAPDQTSVLHKGECKFALPNAAVNATTFTIFGQVQFKVAGTYFIEILVDDVMKLRYPVPVLVAQAPKGPAAQPTPPPPPSPAG